MKKMIKSKYVIPVVALLLISFVIILNTNKSSDDEMDRPEHHRTDHDIHFNNYQSMIDEGQKEKSNNEMKFPKTTFPEQKNENDENNSVNKTYINNPKNLKLKGLIEKAVRNVDGLPQYVWEPVRFNENDINEHIEKLERIVIYSNKVKSNNESIDDKRILSELISREIKGKIEYFNEFCTNVFHSSVAKNDDDQRIIEDSFRECNEKIKELEVKLDEYENKY
jgi:hypothetical protein